MVGVRGLAPHIALPWGVLRERHLQAPSLRVRTLIPSWVWGIHPSDLSCASSPPRWPTSNTGHQGPWLQPMNVGNTGIQSTAADLLKQKSMTRPTQTRTGLTSRTRCPIPLAWKQARPRGWSRGRTEAGQEIGTSPCGSRGVLGVVVETRDAIPLWFSRQTMNVFTC